MLEGTQRVYTLAKTAGATWHTSITIPPAAAARERLSLRSRGRDRPDRAASTTPTTSPRRATRRARRTCTCSPAPARRRRGRRRSWSLRSAAPASTTSRRSRSTPRRSSPHRNRVYVAWTRVARNTSSTIVVSSLRRRRAPLDAPVTVPAPERRRPDVRVASPSPGTATVYVAWTDQSRYGVPVARSVDGGRHFAPEVDAAAFSLIPIPHCGIGIVVRAEPRSCIQANPTVAVDTSRGRYSGRVYVGYTGTNYTGDEGAALTTFDRRLRPVAGYPMLGGQAPADRADARGRRGRTSSGPSPRSTGPPARCGCASTTRPATRPARGRGTRARSRATAAGRGRAACRSPPPTPTRRRRARPTSTATTRGSRSPAASPTRSGRTRGTCRRSARRSTPRALAEADIPAPASR